MNLKGARSEIKIQEKIRGGKVKVSGGLSSKLDALIKQGFDYFEKLRKTEEENESAKNELAIRNLAKKLGINEKELEIAFKWGMQANIKASYKLGIISEKNDLDLDAIIGAYVLNFRSTLNRFVKLQKKESPNVILNIAKRMYLLSPKIFEELTKKYKDNELVDSRMIKRFIIYNPKDPKEAIENAIKKINELTEKYKDNKLVNPGMIKHFVIYNPENPEKAIEDAIEKINKLIKKYKDNKLVDPGMIKHFVIYNPENPEKAIEDAIEKINKLTEKYKDNELIKDWIIKRSVVHSSKNPEKAIKNVIDF